MDNSDDVVIFGFPAAGTESIKGKTDKAGRKNKYYCPPAVRGICLWSSTNSQYAYHSGVSVWYLWILFSTGILCVFK